MYFGDKDQYEHLRRTEHKAEAGQRDTAVTIGTRGPDHPVKRKGDRRQYRKHKACDRAGHMQRIDQNGDPGKTDDQRNNGMTVYLLVQYKKGKYNDKHRIAAEQHRNDGSFGIYYRQLEKDHTYHDADETGSREEKEIIQFKVTVSGVKPFDRKREKDDRSDQKTKKGQLHGIEIAGCDFEHDFHGTE
jgi:hypothetical protein